MFLKLYSKVRMALCETLLLFDPVAKGIMLQIGLIASLFVLFRKRQASIILKSVGN